MIYRPIPEIFRDVVTEVQKTITVYFDYGTTLEVVNRLKVKTNSDSHYDKKYPLIWMLIGDSVSEDVNTKGALKRKANDLSIIICSQTSAHYSSEERYNNLFIPILRPIYDELIKQLKLSKEFKSENGFEHKYYENLYWGRNGLYGHEGNIFDDRLDAIIIDTLDLFIIQNC